MENKKDIRWLQRYDNYHKACGRLLEVTESDQYGVLSDLEQEGLVQRFEYTYELAWKVLQDLLNFKGYNFTSGPNGTLKKAFEDGLITDHDGWRKMSKSRNILSHVYSEEEVLAVVEQIFSEYSLLLKELDEKLSAISQNKDFLNT